MSGKHHRANGSRTILPRPPAEAVGTTSGPSPTDCVGTLSTLGRPQQRPPAALWPIQTAWSTEFFYMPPPPRRVWPVDDATIEAILHDQAEALSAYVGVTEDKLLAPPTILADRGPQAGTAGGTSNPQVWPTESGTARHKVCLSPKLVWNNVLQRLEVAGFRATTTPSGHGTLAPDPIGNAIESVISAHWPQLSRSKLLSDKLASYCYGSHEYARAKCGRRNDSMLPMGMLLDMSVSASMEMFGTLVELLTSNAGCMQELRDSLQQQCCTAINQNAQDTDTTIEWTALPNAYVTKSTQCASGRSLQV